MLLCLCFRSKGMAHQTSSAPVRRDTFSFLPSPPFSASSRFSVYSLPCRSFSLTSACLAQCPRTCMHALPGDEFAFPVLTQKSLWDKSGRWEEAGDELMRMTDRKGGDYCLGPFRKACKARQTPTLCACLQHHSKSHPAQPALHCTRACQPLCFFFKNR